MIKILNIILICFFVTSCDEDKPSKSSPIIDNSNPTETPTPNVVTETLNSEIIQVKNLNLLRDSIGTCVGQGFTTIKDSMFLSKVLSTVNPDETLNDSENLSNDVVNLDRVRFLTPNEFPVGSDVFDIESIRDRLVNTEKDNRFSSVADGVTFTYLSTLQLIGDIVAHNCSSSIGTCQCSSRVKAAGLVSRCFPYLNQKTEAFDETVETIKSVCEQDFINGVPGYRVAIASIISSLAFAVSR